MTTAHPYRGIAAYRHWQRAPGADNAAELDPQPHTKFTISPQDSIATAGSCFAQHVARHLKNSGFNALVTELAPAILPRDIASKFHYGLFTARFGNIYTARQLRQLVERAYGQFSPEATAWRRGDAYVDPFRPTICDFVSTDELSAERDRHLAAVRKMVETLDVFVFTLGLTEAWLDRDGTVFPVAPGVHGGAFDPERYTLKNFTVEETAEDLRATLDIIRRHNKTARTVLTVSPVPLMATALDRHVLVSTTYSKAVLRVAAQMVTDNDPLTDYFPSYEIITAPHCRGEYFGADARSVTQAGVDHVMRVFFKAYAGVEPAIGEKSTEEILSNGVEHRKKTENILEVICEEDLLRSDEPPQ
ncbi:MAG: GSCFA domain-containing protein [Pseudomonadota bacterium]